MKKSTIVAWLALFAFIFGGVHIAFTRVTAKESRQASAVVLAQHRQAEEKVATTSSITDPFYVVTRVVDGDTIHVSIEGKDTTIRLIGVNTPETVDPRRKVECFGKEASVYMKSLLTDRKVRLESDPTQDVRDKYGRLLAYVYREDGLFINKELIARGYAYEYTYKIPYEYQVEFKKLQEQARLEGKGLWQAGVCEK